MNAPWHNKTGLTKAIAIVATIGILAFGLCTAGVATGAPGWDNGAGHLLSWVLNATLAVVPLSLITLIVLFIARAIQRRRNR